MLQRVIDFCHEHKIVPRIKMVTANDLDRVYDELNKKNDTILRLNTFYFQSRSDSRVSVVCPSC